MARRQPNPQQVMGNQTSFNLNDEIARWRSQMLARESISSENVRELETHLRDTVTSLTSSNLTEEEAFWLAERRLGSPAAGPGDLNPNKSLPI